jgi:uncharacterized membrane protein
MGKSILTSTLMLFIYGLSIFAAAIIGAGALVRVAMPSLFDPLPNRLGWFGDAIIGFMLIFFLAILFSLVCYLQEEYYKAKQKAKNRTSCS